MDIAPSVEEPDPCDVVATYYRLIDAGDIDGLVELFEPTATYDRPGHEQIVGKAALDRFFRSQNVAGNRTHIITKTVCEGRDIAVHGRAERVSKDGERTTVHFADFFTLSHAGRFSHRRTFFYVPFA